MRKIIIATAATAMLAACGGPEGSFEDEEGNRVDYEADSSGENTELRIRGEDGEEVVVNSGTGVTPDLPHGFTTYPGATVVSSSNIATNDGTGSIVFMTTSDSTGEVAAFYHQQADAAGITIAAETTTAAMHALTGNTDDGKGFQMTASATGDGTSVQLMVGQDLGN